MFSHKKMFTPQCIAFRIDSYLLRQIQGKRLRGTRTTETSIPIAETLVPERKSDSPKAGIV